MSKISDEVGHQREREQFSSSTQRIIGGGEVLDQDARDSAQKAISRVETHETLCTERWNQQRVAMAMVQKSLDAMAQNTLGRIPAGIIACLTGLVGWLAARAFPVH